MKKIVSIILAVVLVLGLSVFGITSQDEVHAKTAQMHLEVPDSIKKEQEFKVKVVLDSDTQLYSIDAYLAYNAELLEFVPDNQKVTGAEGVLELKDVFSEETMDATYEITFKALETGTAEVSLTDVYLIDYADLDYITVTPSAKQFEIGVNKMVAEDARLSELIVAPGEFTESFQPDKLEYEMHVGLDIETVGVSAIPMNDDSIVRLDMPEKLCIGENIIKVTVTALSGNVNEYIIKVIREEIVESSDDMSVDNIDTTQEETSTESTTEEASTEESTTEETVTGEDTTENSTEDEAVHEEDTTEEALQQDTNEETVNGQSTTGTPSNDEAVTSENTTEKASITNESTKE